MPVDGKKITSGSGQFLIPIAFFSSNKYKKNQHYNFEETTSSTQIHHQNKEILPETKGKNFPSIFSLTQLLKLGYSGVQLKCYAST